MSDEDLACGVRIVNLHHANNYNPHISYPFMQCKKSSKSQFSPLRVRGKKAGKSDKKISVRIEII